VDALSLLGVASLGGGLLAFTALLGFSVVTWYRGITGRALFGASLASLAFVVTLAITGESRATQSLASAMELSWILLLLRALGLGPATAREAAYRPVLYLAATALGLAAIGITHPWTLSADAFRLPGSGTTWSYAAQLLLAISGLVVIEQLGRNLRDDLRWRLRYLNIGLAVVLLFFAAHNALALLIQQHYIGLTLVQPVALGLSVPLIMLASLRNRDNRLKVNLSRRFVFRSTVLFITGVVLVGLGITGYYVRLFGGELGTALLVLLGLLSLIALAAVLGSRQFQRTLRQLIAENLYDQKYDYREEWQRLSHRLTEPGPDFNVGQQALRAVLDVVGGSRGAIWSLTPGGALVSTARFNADWRQPLSAATGQALQAFFARKEWIIDLRQVPEEFDEWPQVEGEFEALAGAGYLMPLATATGLFGIVVTDAAEDGPALTWEDYTLLQLMLRQSAGVLALQAADADLAESRQLSTFHQYSAFMIHDLKTVVAQLSLITSNASQHKHNPEFVEDMLETVENAVTRMQQLLAQLRSTPADVEEQLELNELLDELVKAQAGQSPRPAYSGSAEPLWVYARRQELADAIGHTLQNAIEATPATGSVTLTLLRAGSWAEIHIEDSGEGMSQRFIDEELFQPFKSSKGVSGMGLGAYQSRALLRAAGGDLDVSSRPGAGTRVVLRIPLTAAPQAVGHA